ncbi:MAG: o-succinylbenzoate synthase [Candidatus Omnitrophica bacterium]|nr:o-succinylbenzoate synthase [Candidatus Omnitrophota bacterium]
MEHIKVRNIYYYPYELPLERPFVVKGVPLHKREGVIIQVVSDKGHVGFGEAAPLPGMSGEDLRKTVHQLDRMKDELCFLQLPREREALLDFLSTRFAGDLVVPSVRFGIESAFLSMVANVSNMSVAQFLGQKNPVTVSCAGLLQGGYQDVRSQMASLRSQGYKIFELRAGSRNIPLDIQKVEGLKELMGPRETLRINADGQWSFQEAIIFAQSIGKNQVDFLEEPCGDVALWEGIYRKTDMPLAMGESLAKIRVDDLEFSQAVSALVVRPMIHAGVSGFIRALRIATGMGKQVVVGGAFESGVGQSMLANLAVLTGQAAALGSSTWLKTNLLEKPLISWGGVIFFEDLVFSPGMFLKDFRNGLEFV